MTIWSAWEDISRIMAILCLITAGAAFAAAGILLVREELTGRFWDALKSEAGRRTGILAIVAAGVWILVIGRSVSAAEVPQAGSTADTSAGAETEISAAAEADASATGETAAEAVSESESAAIGEAVQTAAGGSEAAAASETAATSEAAAEEEPGSGEEAARPDEKSPIITILMTEETNEDEEGVIYCRQDNAGIRIRLADDREDDTGIVFCRIAAEDSEGHKIERESETYAGEASIGIVIETEEIAQLADGPVSVRAWAADAAGNKGEAEITFVLDTQPPVLAEVRSYSCRGDLETEVPEGTIYDGTDLYYCDEKQVTRFRIEDDNAVSWRIQYYLHPGKSDKNGDSVVSRQIEGKGSEGSAFISEEGIYSDWLIAGEDSAGNKLLAASDCRCTQDTEEYAQTEEGVLLERRRILDRTAPVGEICCRSDVKGFLYRGKSDPSEPADPGSSGSADSFGTGTGRELTEDEQAGVSESIACAEVYYGGDVEVSLCVSDRCAGSEMPVDPELFKLIRTENGTGEICSDGKFLVCEDSAVQFSASGRDRAGNALVVREAFLSPVETVRPGESEGPEKSGGLVIVRDTVRPVACACVSRPYGNPAGIDDENAIVYYGGDSGQYRDGSPVLTVSLRVSDLNPDPGRIEMRTAFKEVPDGMCCEDVKLQWSDAVREECGVKLEEGGEGLPGEVLMTMSRFPGSEGMPDGVYRFGIAGTDKAGNPLALADAEAEYAGSDRQNADVESTISESTVSESAVGENTVGNNTDTEDELWGFVCVNAEEGAFMTGRKVIDTTAPRGEISISNREDEVYCRMTAHGRGWTCERDGFMPFRREREAVISYRAEDTSPVSASCRLLSTAGERNEAAPGEDRFMPGCEGEIRIRGGQIFRIENWAFRDRAGNASAVLRRTVEFYLDTQLPEADIDAPAAVVRTVPEITSRSADGRGLYNGTVTLEIIAEDPDREHGGSGLREVFYSIKNNGETVMEDVVFSGGEVPAEPSDEEAPDPVYRFSGEIRVPSGGEWESNDIEVTVVATDNAGNRSNPENGGSLQLGIDSTGPAVTVRYDNNEVRNGRYFGGPRKAVIEVLERNLDREKLKVTAPGAVMGEWKRHSGTELWAMEVQFAVDGEYTLEVSGADALGNAAAVTYTGEAPQDFVIDRIPPLIEVVWDNEDVRNGKYYNRPRCATIRITELSLDERAVQIFPFARALRRVSQTRDERTTGAAYVYEAEVPFTEEGEWSVRCACTDLAGNTAVPVQEDAFIIDMTAPGLYFDPDSVREMGSYGSGISPVLKCGDPNTAPGSLYAVWTNLTAGGCAMECRSGSVQDGNGEVILPELPEERAADGICMLYGTACDLAGNRSRVRRNLCVNRFGSLYDISEDPGTMEIVQGYYTDALKPFVIAEYNVSPIKSRQITLYRNSGARVLEESADYTVMQEKSAAGMKYVYVIDPAAYREEGKYSVLIESEDEAGNICRSPGRFRAGTEYSPTWAVDRTPPQVRIAQEDADGQKYVADSVVLSLVPSDNMELKNLEIQISDDQGRLIEKRVISGQELREVMDRNGGEVPVTIRADAGWQTLRAVAADGAGNRSSGICGIGEDGRAEFCRVLVSANLMVHLYRSGILPAVAFLAFLSAFRFAYGVYKRALA